MTFTPDDLAPIIARVRTDVTAAKTASGSSIWKKDEPLTLERVKAHIAGKQLRGVCPIKEGESTTMLALFDLDSHKGDVPDDEMVMVAQRIYDTAHDLGVFFEVFRSSGGRGIHMIAIWDSPQDAYSVRQIMASILSSVGLKSGTGGVSKGEVEIFPKQDRVHVGGFGNQFILPYSPKGVPLDANQPVEWRASAPVPIQQKELPSPKPFIAPRADDDQLHDVIDALKATPADDYNAWVEIGMALKDEYGEAGFDLWDKWSSTSSKYNGREMRSKWHSFQNTGIQIATLFFHANSYGWTSSAAPQSRAEREHRETPMAKAFIDKYLNELKEQIYAHPEPEVEQQEKPKLAIKVETPYGVKVLKMQNDKYTKNFNFRPEELPGLIGETVRHIIRYSQQPQPELALLNTIASAAAVFGRKYSYGPLDTRTNLYIVGVARTGAGKDFSRKYITNLFNSAGLSEYIGAAYIRSDMGLLMELVDNPSHVIMLDEFGMYLGAISNPRAGTHLRNITGLLTTLYTHSGQKYSHGRTKTEKDRVDIFAPNLCLYGTTTEEEYLKALRRDMVISGEMNRFIVYKSSRTFDGTEPEPPSFTIEESLSKLWAEHSPANGLFMPAMSGVAPKPIKIQPENDDVGQIIRDCYIYEKSIVNSNAAASALWGRYREQILKIAMVFAVCDNKSKPVIKDWHMEVARNIVDTCLGYMANIAENCMADSDYEALQQKIIQYLSQCRRHQTTMTELNNRFRSVKSKERREALGDLVTQDIISIEKGAVKKGATRSAEVVKLLVGADE